jgi:hypothetical protein
MSHRCYAAMADAERGDNVKNRVALLLPVACLALLGAVINVGNESSIAFAGVGPPASDPSELGPFVVSTDEYRFNNVSVPRVPYPVDLWGVVFYPTGLPEGPYPLVIFLHGNHGICRQGTSDFCAPDPPSCPGGYTQTPNHRGYDYAASRLASYGYIVVSISANAINCRADGIPERGRLVLAHLDRWAIWNSPDGAPPFGARFSGKVDLNNTGLMGHSRGGEGVRAAYNYNYNEGLGYGINAVYEIGPVDFNRRFNIFDTPWSVLLPGCDGDVSDNQGMRAFDRAQTLSEPIYPSPKAQQFIWGTNHNFYNQEWLNDDGRCMLQTRISKENQEQAGRVYLMGFFRTFLGGESFYDLFTADHTPPASVQTVVDSAYTEGRDYLTIIDDFTASQSPNVNTAGGANTANNLGISTCSSNCGSTWRHDPVKRAGAITWPGGGSGTPSFQLALAPGGAAVDVSGNASLSFRVAEQLSTLNPSSGIQNFSVVLVTAGGTVSNPATIANYGAVRIPVGSVDRKSVLKTVRVPLDLFRADLTQVTHIKFLFDQVATGAIFMSDIVFSP